MNTKKTEFLGLIATIVVCLLLIAGIGVYIAIPWIARAMLWYFKDYTATLIFMYIGGGAGLWFLVEFLLLMLSVKRGNSFTLKTVRSLLRIAVCCAIAASAFVFTMFFCPSLTLAICGGILLFGMLCAIVLAMVFRQAVTIKQENDLTI